MRLAIIISFTTISFTGLYAQSTASKQVSTFIIEAPQLDTIKKIWVYLPKSYHEKELKFYPVIYMHDAQNLFDASTSYVGEWGIDEYLDSQTGDEAIIIGIEHGGVKRIDELTPYPHKDYGGGSGENYISFIKNTLKPHVDITYRTLNDPENTSIMGSSLGGLASFFAVINYPDTFGNAGIFSPSFWFNKKIYNLVKDSFIPPRSRFYFLCGSDEDETMVSNQIEMVTLLKEMEVSDQQIVNKIIDGGKHNEAFWQSNFPEAFHWLIIRE